MLHTIFGVLLLIGSAVLLLKYRPREREGRMTWCVCVGLALLSLIMQAVSYTHLTLPTILLV